jgi:CRISPR-associated protein Cst2
MNLFATVLTYAAPSANYRGESAENRSIIQKITKGRFEYAIISPEAMRNALREHLRRLGLPSNRERLGDEEQLAVKFQHYPDAEQYADDFFMGWLIATKDRGAEKENLILDTSDPRGQSVRDSLVEINGKIKEAKDDGAKKKLKARKDALLSSFPMSFKHDSILRMNMAVAVEPHRHDAVFTQSPLAMDSPWKNSDKSALLHRETAYTAFQYPFALNLEECRGKPDWTRTLLQAIGELNDVAGNHARSYFEMAPASLVARLTSQLAAGYDSYGFRVDEGKHRLPEVVEGILKGDYPGGEFFLGGQIVKEMAESQYKALAEMGVTLDRNPQRLLMTLADRAGLEG